jgi:death-on-curing protein
VNFPTKDEVVETHDRLLSASGGEPGFLNEPALESAMDAARNRAHYEGADLALCAATYAFHLTKAHAFVDGNKRVGAAAAELFLFMNDAVLHATNDEFHDLILAVAASKMTRDDVDAWFAARVRESPPGEPVA